MSKRSEGYQQTTLLITKAKAKHRTLHESNLMQMSTSYCFANLHWVRPGKV